MPINEVKSKYNPVIGLVKGFFDLFGKKLTCWTHIVNYNNIDYYSILTDLDELNTFMQTDDNYNKLINYYVLPINKLSKYECSSDLIWLTYMSLDPNIKETKIINL